MTDWSDERVKQLKHLVAEGTSAGQIAQAIGISRSAVIGKVSRLGLRLQGGNGGNTGGRPRLAASVVQKKPKLIPPEKHPVVPLVPPTDDEIYRAYANAIFTAARYGV